MVLGPKNSVIGLAGCDVEICGDFEMEGTGFQRDEERGSTVGGRRIGGKEVDRGDKG